MPFLKAVIYLGSLMVLVMCAFLFNTLLAQNVRGYQPILIMMLAASIPFFIGTYQTIKLLDYIKTNNVFSHRSIGALNVIKCCGIVIGTLYGISLPYIFIVAERDDAPGVVLLGLIFTFAPVVVAVSAAVFKNLLKNTIDLKFENELTV